MNFAKFLRIPFIQNTSGRLLLKSYEDIYHSPYVSVITRNILIATDFLYLGTMQIWRNLNEHCYCLTSTKSVIWQIVANCSPLQALDMLPFQIRLERVKLIYYGLMSIFSKYYFEADTVASFSYLHKYLSL